MRSRIEFVNGMDRMGGGGRGGIGRIAGEIGRDGMRYEEGGGNKNEGGNGINEGVGPVEVGVFLGEGEGWGGGQHYTPIFITYFFSDIRVLS